MKPKLALPIPELEEDQQRFLACEMVKLAPGLAAAEVERAKATTARSAAKRGRAGK